MAGAQPLQIRSRRYTLVGMGAEALLVSPCCRTRRALGKGGSFSSDCAVAPSPPHVGTAEPPPPQKVLLEPLTHRLDLTLVLLSQQRTRRTS
jgi:hypothetical protein